MHAIEAFTKTRRHTMRFVIFAVRFCFLYIPRQATLDSTLTVA